MKKKVGNLKGGRNVIPDGAYKLKCCDFQIKHAPAGPYVVVDVMVVGPEHQQAFFGQHTEIGFSMAGAGVKPWLVAMGMKEEDEIEMDDKNELESILRTHCKGRIVMAEVIKIKNTQGYENNTIDKPWINIGASELSKGDYEGEATTSDAIPF